MPLIGVLLGGLDFSSLAIKVGSSKIAYGMFIQSVVDFLIVAACIFSVIKIFEKFKRSQGLAGYKGVDCRRRFVWICRGACGILEQGIALGEGSW